MERFVRRFLIVTVAAVALAGLGAGAATAGQTPGCVSAYTKIEYLADSGFARLFSTGWWTTDRSATSQAAWYYADAPVCATDPGVVAAANAFWASETKFWALYRAFPSAPTARQWKTRYVPLIRTALAADQEIIRVRDAMVIATTNANASGYTLSSAGNPMNLDPRSTMADKAALRALLTRGPTGV